MKNTLRLTCSLVIGLCVQIVSAQPHEEMQVAPLAKLLVNRGVFPDGLTYVSPSVPSDIETERLWQIFDWITNNPPVPEQLMTFEAFISSHLDSTWTPSLRANLGNFYRKRGQFSLSLLHWEAAWASVRTNESTGAKEVGDFVLGNLTELLAHLGHRERLGELLQETSNRTLNSPWQQRYNGSKEAWQRMMSTPEQAFRCGVVALTKLAEALTIADTDLPRLRGEIATREGLSLARLLVIAERCKLPLQAVDLPAAADPVVPSIVHYKIGHFATLLKRDGNNYLVADPVFRKNRWLRKEVIQSESSGRYLIPAGLVMAGLRRLSAEEAEAAAGRGYPSAINDEDDHYQSMGPSGTIPALRISEPYLNLWLQSEILRYPLPGGMSQSLDLVYKQRNSRSTASAFNFGPSWECSWLSYVDYTSEYDELPGSIHHYYHYVTDIHMPLAGVGAYDGSGDGGTYYNFSKFTFSFHDASLTTSFSGWFVNSSHLHYTEQQTFALGQYRAYLGYMYDPQGRSSELTYFQTNGFMCLNKYKDFAGQQTRFLYKGSSVDKVSGVVDPFGRTNVLSYNTSGQLTNILNPISFGPTFTYDSQGAITNVGGPYGNTGFSYMVNTNSGNVVNRSMQVTTDSGAKQLFIYRDQSTYLNSTSTVTLIPFSYPSTELPDLGSFSNTLDNTWMDARNTFCWTPANFNQLSAGFLASGNFNALTTNDYKLAHVKHWLRATSSADTLSGTLSMERDPSPDGTNEGQKVWYDYHGKASTITTNGSTVSTNWFSVGSSPAPKFVAMRLPDGTTKYKYSQYNSSGNPTITVTTWSPSSGGVLTRTNTLVYATNLIDLVAVYNEAGELVVSNIWNSRHQVTTNYDAIGQTTVAFYQASSPCLSLGKISPAGLASTNYYFTTGPTNYLEKTVIEAYGITNSFTYTNGLIYTATSERGLTITNFYDAAQRIVRVEYGNGTALSAFTNASLLWVVDRLGYTNWFGYDSYGRRIWNADALGRTNKCAYSPDGRLLATTNALGEALIYIYDNLDHQITRIGPDGRGMTNRFNVLGQLVSTIDPAGVAATNYYNNQGLLVAVSNVFGLVQFTEYDILDRTTNTVNGSGISLATTYDLLSRVRTQKSSDGAFAANGYTTNVAAVTSVTNQLGFVTRYAYDLAGRLSATTNANNEVVRRTYGVSGELLSLVDGKNQTNTYGYDIYGRQTSKTNASGVRTGFFQYDGEGRVTNKWTPAKGNINYKFDAAGNLTNVTYPNNVAQTFIYDPINRVTNRSDAIGQTAYLFNNLGQLISEDGPWVNDTISNAFTVNGLLQSVSVAQRDTAAWIQTYAYDQADRLTNTTSPAGGFGYSFAAGLNGYSGMCFLVNRGSIPGGAYFTNNYDSQARLLSTKLVTTTGAVLDSFAYSYNLGGQVTNKVRFDNSNVKYDHDQIGQLVSAKASDPGNVPRLHEQFSYKYDSANNLSYKTNNGLVQNFTCDALNQLSIIGSVGTLTVAGFTTTPATNVSINNIIASRYADYSFAKDGFSFANGNNSFTAVARDSLGHISTNNLNVTLASNVTYVYDLNGNLLSDGLLGYDYDDENQLIRVTATNAWKTEFAYDGTGQRRIRTEYSWLSTAWSLVSETCYVYVNGLVAQERDANSYTLVAYTRGPDKGGGIGGLLARTDCALFQAGSSLAHAYYYSDGCGNISSLINTNQLIIGHYLYDPYGNTLMSSGAAADANTYRYSSKDVHGKSGLIYFGFRFYNPGIQRWMNNDPIGVSGGLNLFAYVGNSPLLLIDPRGHQWAGAQRANPDEHGFGSWMGALSRSPGFGPGGPTRFIRATVVTGMTDGLSSSLQTYNQNMNSGITDQQDTCDEDEDLSDMVVLDYWSDVFADSGEGESDYRSSSAFQIVQSAAWGAEEGIDSVCNFVLGLFFTPDGLASPRFDPIQNLTELLTGYSAYEPSDIGDSMKDTAQELVPAGQQVILSIEGRFGTSELPKGSPLLPGSNKSGQINSRAKWRTGVEDTVWGNAPLGPTGGRVCVGCGKEVFIRSDWAMDHIYPWSLPQFSPSTTRAEYIAAYNCVGGLRLLCVPCNSVRGAGP